MNALQHLDAVRAFLAPLEYATHLVYADKVTSQYLVLTGPAWARPAEMPVAQVDQALDTDLRVKAVAGTVDGVGIMLGRIRDQLSPGLGPVRVPMEGWVLEARYVRSEFVDVDRDTTITGTNRHPAVGVDTYHLTGEPV